MFPFCGKIHKNKTLCAFINYNKTLWVQKNKTECTNRCESLFGGRGVGLWRQACRVGQN
jgi:hypothetical protein